MLYQLLYSLHTYPALRFLNVVRYVSTRTILAILTALLMSLLLGPRFIGWLRKLQIGETIRTDGPEGHKKKAGTPTMGGTLILFTLVIPTLLWCDLQNRFIWVALTVTTSFGLIGFLDDYRKLRVSKKGLPGRVKLLLQTLIAAGVVAYIFYGPLYDPDLRFRVALPLIDFYRHPVVVAAGTFLILCYGTGALIKGFNIAEYLKIPYIAGAGELAIFCGSLAGAGVGFLWYNTYPAQVFMGDVGSLSLGGALGTLAVLTKNEFTLVILGGVFVAETLSVMLQVGSFKLTGKRLFKMAPLHHHFEMLGWAEPKIIVRFWIISIMLALIALATLKVR